jgi:hypothetical protein
VYDLELDVIGQLDCIMFDTATGEYILLDWKHWKIDTSLEKHGGVWHPLFPGLDDTKVCAFVFLSVSGLSNRLP